jgi:hypothetical protein
MSLRSLLRLVSPLSLAICLGALPANAADEPAAEFPTAVDVTKSVEVRTTGALRSDRGGAFFTGVVVKNTSDDVLTGRLVVVVDETGIEGLTVSEGDGELESGEMYLEVLPATAKLTVGENTPSIRLPLQSDRPISVAERRSFALVARVFQLGEEPAKVAAGPALDAEQNLPGKTYSQRRFDQVLAIQDKYTEQLMQHEGVFGTATAENDEGELVVQVFTQRHGIAKELPGEVEGVELDQKVIGSHFRAGPATDRVVQIGGRKRALPRAGVEPEADASAQAIDPSVVVPPGTVLPTDPTLRTRPISIGTSIFNFNAADCAAGTLGCRIVFPDGTLGILTNAHVGSQEDIGISEDPVTGVAGDPLTQPGCLDNLTGTPLVGDQFAVLVDFQLLTAAEAPNSLDAAIARITLPSPETAVLATTPIDGYGAPTQTPVPARLGMEVVKYGRTTGYREGRVDAVNSNVVIEYENFDVHFTGQIVIRGDHAAFSDQGDSGSLIVTKKEHHPVGLLFAGSTFLTIANPIGLVCERFNIAIDDGSGSPPAPGVNGTARTPGAGASGRMGYAGGTFIPDPTAP